MIVRWRRAAIGIVCVIAVGACAPSPRQSAVDLGVAPTALAAKAATQRVTHYVYSLEESYLIGEAVTVTSSAGSETAWTTRPHGDVTVSIPASDNEYTVTIQRAGYCPYSRTFPVGLTASDRWIRLVPCE